MTVASNRDIYKRILLKMLNIRITISRLGIATVTSLFHMVGLF